MMNNLQGKKILFFTASFMGFQYDIKKCLESFGAKVDWFDERMSEDTLTKIIVRLNRKAISHKINKYYEEILNSITGNKYDFVFFVNIEAATKVIITKYRKAFPNAKFILYEWDSIRNNKNALDNLSIFDEVWSFDKNDCNEYHIKFLPLFYLDKYAYLKKKEKYSYKLLFVGTTHSDRYTFVKAIEKQVCKKGEQSFLWFYFPSKLLYYKMKLTDKKFRLTSSKKDFKFETLHQEELLRIVEDSEIVVDAQHPKQSGLTMRTIETLGARKKLITTNKDIVNYDFYCRENILVVDRCNPVVTEEFLNSKYREISETIYKKYSLYGWLSTIFCSNGDN